MKKLIKVLFTVFLSIFLTTILTMNNVKAAEPTDGDDYNSLSTKQKIEYHTVLSRLSMNYTIEYDFEWAVSTNTGGSTWLFQPSFLMNLELDYNTNISSNVVNKYSSVIQINVLKNNSTDNKVILDEKKGIKLGHSSDGNGSEIVVKMLDNRYIEKIAVAYTSYTEGYCEITTNALNEPTYDSINGYYTYNVIDECYEARFKNTNPNEDVYIEKLFFDTGSYKYNVTKFGFKKDNDGKNLNSMQLVGRIPSELYKEIRVTYPTQEIKFGMLYARKDKISDEYINIALTSFNTDKCSFISEIDYESLKGYDSQGINLESDNPTYYQWGVTINNISIEKKDVKIVAIPYVKIGHSSNVYEIICLQRRVLSFADICKEYSSLLEVNSLNKKAIDYFNDSN